jgi:hypothetical protein
MTRVPRLIAMFVAALVCSTAAHAECSATGCYSVQVYHLSMTATNGFWVQTTGTETLANCTPDSGVFFHVPAGTAQLKEIYATLLSAQLTDRLVDIVINQGTNPCTVTYVNLFKQ